MRFDKERQWSSKGLWEGCIIASVAHAIMVAHYPEVSSEHSWDHLNYNTQNSEGSRGTITFTDEICIGAFRNDLCNRASKIRDPIQSFFTSASDHVIDIAKQETLQYLLINYNGTPTPHITSAFWIIDDTYYSEDNTKEMFENGGHLLERQVMDNESGMIAWKEYYDMSLEQVDLLKDVTKTKLSQPKEKIILEKNKLKAIGTDDIEGLEESKVSFSEIGIFFE